MTKVFRMAINIMNMVQFQGGMTDVLQGICMRYCGFDILDILVKCFGGSLRSKGSMLKIKDFKHVTKYNKISNYRANSL
jgi:hypothetical protein